VTARGRDVHAAAVADIRRMEQSFLSGLTPAERESLLAVLPRLA
jgi:hypothetical protein